MLEAPHDYGGNDINKHDFTPVNHCRTVEHNHDDYGIDKYHHDCPACRIQHGPSYDNNHSHTLYPPHPRAAFRGDIINLVDEDLFD